MVKWCVCDRKWQKVCLWLRKCASVRYGQGSPPGRLFPLLVWVINTSVPIESLSATLLWHTLALPLSVVTESSRRCQGLAGVCQNKRTERWPPVKESRAFTSGREEEKKNVLDGHTHTLPPEWESDWGSLWHRHLRPCHYNLPAGRAESYNNFKYLDWPEYSPDIGLVLMCVGIFLKETLVHMQIFRFRAFGNPSRVKMYTENRGFHACPFCLTSFFVCVRCLCDFISKSNRR